MARPRSNEKREALIEAAIEVFAQRGALTSPTSAVSQRAGVSEGTLFTYFERKDDLLNEVYLALKRELADAILARLAPDLEFEELARQVWTEYVRWGVKSPTHFKVLRELGASSKISAGSRAEGNEPFNAMMSQAKLAIDRGEIRKLPLQYVIALLNGMAEGTVAFVGEGGGSLKTMSARGFEVFWAGISLESG